MYGFSRGTGLALQKNAIRNQNGPEFPYYSEKSIRVETLINYPGRAKSIAESGFFCSGRYFISFFMYVPPNNYVMHTNMHL